MIVYSWRLTQKVQITGVKSTKHQTHKMKASTSSSKMFTNQPEGRHQTNAEWVRHPCYRYIQFTWCKAVIPAMLILLTSRSREARRSMQRIISPENVLSIFWLSSTIPYICHPYHIYIDREKISHEISPHVKEFQISHTSRCGEIWNVAKFKGISNFSTWQMWRNLKFNLFLLQTLFSGNFVAKSVLSRLTLFSLEKNEPKLCKWRKDYKYEVCLQLILL